MSHNPGSLPSFTRWPSFPFEGDLRIRPLNEPVAVEPPRKGEDPSECASCTAPDEAYIWVNDRWRVRAPDRPSGLPVVLILESRSHLDLGDLSNRLAAELGVMTVRLERAIRSLEGVARVHVNRWGDSSAHLHLWFLARPYGRLQLRGTFLPLWDSILPPIPEDQWRENLAWVAAWLAEFDGRALAEPPRIDWKAPSKLSTDVDEISRRLAADDNPDADVAHEGDGDDARGADRADGSRGDGQDASAAQSAGTSAAAPKVPTPRGAPQEEATAPSSTPASPSGRAT